jgi:hypothetical protein
MAYSSIVKPGDYFNTVTYSGNSSTNNITGVGFQPDWVWMKRRDQTAWHYLNDAVSGVRETIFSNDSNAQVDKTTGLTAFGTDGFTLGSEGDINENGGTYVSWNWKANGAGSSNTDGNVTTTVSANTTAGFSIINYTGTGSNSSTMGHGLGTTPAMIMIKKLDTSSDWRVWHQNLSATTGKNLRLNYDNAEDSNNSFFYSSAPNATTFNPGDGGNTNSNGGTYRAFVFKETTGYSRFGYYMGNGNANGTFIYTGFKPAFYIIKRKDSTGSWIIKDTKRPGLNQNGTYLVADTNIAEATGSGNLATDEYSNGFKMRGTSSAINASGGTYIYMAFAEEPLVANVGQSIPATAR